MKKLFTFLHRHSLLLLAFLGLVAFAEPGSDPRLTRRTNARPTTPHRSHDDTRKSPKNRPSPSTNDPIGFLLRSDKVSVRVGEPLLLTITARHLGIPASLLFTFEQANAYQLKLILPDGFVLTGGTYQDYMSGSLMAGSPPAIYTVEGYFTRVSQPAQFRLLRGGGGSTGLGLFSEKSRVLITVLPSQDAMARLADACSGITLTASAAPGSVNMGGTATLTASCQGCGSGGGTVYSTGFDGEQPNTSFQTDYTDQVRVLTNAQDQGAGFYCSVGDRQGAAGGKLLRFNGESAGRIWEKSLNVVAGTSYTFSVWVRALYDGNPANGLNQREVQLQVNGNLVANPSVPVVNPGCGSGWTQLSGSWTASSSGAVPFTLRMPAGTSWQNALAIDDVVISSGAGSTASYSWQALDGGSLNNANSATTQVTPPNTPGTYRYQVTLTSGGCTQNQQVTVTVNNGPTPCTGISLVASASPSTINAGGTATLSASCQGCGSGGGTVYSTGFDGEQPNTSFQTDYTDQVRILTNAQNGTDTQHCPVTDHSGNGGKLLRFDGESAGRIWEKTVAVVSGSSYSFSVWVQPIYNGNPASGASQQTLQLKANGIVLVSPTVATANPGCGSGWTQLTGNWTATTTGSVPFTIQMPNGSSWQHALVLDDLLISGGSGSGGASYQWTALQAGSSLANPGSASTPVTVPTQPGSYQYRVTLTSGACTTSQDVTVMVTGTNPCSFTPTASVTNANPACGGTVTLNAGCSGSDCGNVSYNWTGPSGFNQSGQSVNATVPTTNGSFLYTLTVSKQNCDNQSASVTVNPTCGGTPRFYVGRAVPGVFEPELFKQGNDWHIRDKVTTYSDDRTRYYNINRAHVGTGSLSDYNLGQRGGRYIVEMTRWRGNSWETPQNGIEAYRFEFILPGYVDEPGAIPTPASFVPSENYVDNSVAMVPAHSVLTGKITVKVKYNKDHSEAQLYGLGATHLSHNAQEADPNKRQVITGEPWDADVSTAVTRQQFNQLSDDYIRSVAQQQGVPALYFSDFETPQRGWSDYGISDNTTLQKLYTFWEALMNANPGRLVTNYYGNLVFNKGFPSQYDARPTPLEQRFKDHYINPSSAVTQAYRSFSRENGTTTSLRNLFNIWLVDDYGSSSYDPNSQYELYRPYSLIHDSRIMRKVVPSTQKIITYAWAGTDQEIGYILKREIVNKGWVSNFTRRYKSAAAVETETYLAYLINDGYSAFHDNDASSSNPEDACPHGTNGDSWEPIAGDPSPIASRPHCYPREPQYYSEHVNLAEYKLAQVNHILNGGHGVDAEYRINGGNWLNTASEGESAILHRAANKQPIVLKKVVGNQAFVVAVAPFAGESNRTTLEVKLADGWTGTISLSGKWPTIQMYSR